MTTSNIETRSPTDAATGAELEKPIASKRYDPGEKLYARAERIEKWVERLGWLAALAFGVYVWFHHDGHAAGGIAKVVFVALTIASLGLGYYHRFVLMPRCDRRRRIMLIGDSLGVDLGEPPQVKYWTSRASPSNRRLVMSLAENTYFYPRLLAHEIPALSCLVLLLVMALLASIRFGTPEWIELCAVVLLFSEVALAKLIRLLWARHQFEALYEYCLTILRNWPRGMVLHAEALKIITEYETIKARSTARASDRTFQRLNPRLTAEWTQICERLERDYPANDSD